MLCTITPDTDEARHFAASVLNLSFLDWQESASFEAARPDLTPDRRVVGVWEVAPVVPLADLTVTLSAGDDALYGGPIVLVFGSAE